MSSNTSGVILRRQLRSRRSLPAGYVDSSNIALSSDEDVPPKTARTTRSSQFTEKTTRSSSEESASYGLSDVNSLQQVKASRRSLRAGRATKSMKEKREDEIWADDSQLNTSAARMSSVKEVFKLLPLDDSFRRMHCQQCDSCGKREDSAVKGLLVFCQGCTLSYHKTCLGPRGTRDHIVTKIASDDFVLQCRHCVGVAIKKDKMAPRQGVCQACRMPGPACSAFRERKTMKQEEREREENGGQDPITKVEEFLINQAANVLFRCCKCSRAFHFSHLPSKGLDMGLDEAEETVRNKRFEEYSQDWACLDCLTAPGKVQTLVAWRPTEIDKYTAGQSVEMVGEDDKEYLVKWEGKSYFRTSWRPGPWVWGVCAPAMRKAFARRDNGHNLPKMSTEAAIPEEYLRIDIVLDVRYSGVAVADSEEVDEARITAVEQALVKYQGLGYEEVVWEDVPTPEQQERWADFSLAYDDWFLGRYLHLPDPLALKQHLKEVRAKDFETAVLKEEQPTALMGGQMMKFQLDGLNWLLWQWYKETNGILADEMGLGKTIQIIGFLAALVHDHQCWPFLVVVPNSTCPNWRREIKRWAPSLRVVAYYGGAQARKLSRKYELFPEGSKDLRCHIVVTSYEVPTDEDDRRLLQRIPWAGLIVDEGQRLKNDNTLLYRALRALKVPMRVLLTGKLPLPVRGKDQCDTNCHQEHHFRTTLLNYSTYCNF